MVRLSLRLFGLAALLLAAAWGMQDRAPETRAHSGDAGFLWFSNTSANSGVDDHTNCCYWWTGISGAVSDWHANTVLWTNTQNHATARIHYYNWNARADGYFGFAWIYSGQTACWTPWVVAPGGCNKTTKKADNAEVWVNDYYWSPWNGNYSGDYQKRRTSAHELGHVFALTHAFCSDGAVMSVAGCWYPNQPPSQGPASHDAYHADLLY